MPNLASWNHSGAGGCWSTEDQAGVYVLGAASAPVAESRLPTPVLAAAPVMPSAARKARRLNGNGDMGVPFGGDRHCAMPRRQTLSPMCREVNVRVAGVKTANPCRGRPVLGECFHRCLRIDQIYPLVVPVVPRWRPAG